MSYAVHYRMSFTSINGSTCRFDILENNYVGDIVSIIGAGRSPVVQSWDAAGILDPIQGCKCVVKYINERGASYAPELPVIDFATTDDTKFRGDFYVNSILQFTGFMVIDEFTEPYLTPPVEASLTFTDNLALLEDLTLNQAGFSVTCGNDMVNVFSLIDSILSNTSLDLPIRSYYNLFPDSPTDYVDRNINPATTALNLQSVNIRMFLSDDTTFISCKDALTQILSANCCVLRQEKGEWVIIRIPEYARFSGNIPGGTDTTQPLSVSAEWTDSGPGLGGVFRILNGLALISYFPVGGTMTISNSSDPTYDGDYTIDFVGTDSPDILVSVPEQPATGISVPLTFDVATTLTNQVAPDLNTITIGQTGDLLPLDRSQQKAFSRPAKQVSHTFKWNLFEYPSNSKLQILGNFIGQTSAGDVYYRDYELAHFSNQFSEAAFIRIVYDAVTDKENDRYIYMPFSADQATGSTPDGVLFCSIRVSEGDRVSLSLKQRAATNSSDNALYRIGVSLFADNGSKYNLIRTNNTDPAVNKLAWNAGAGVAYVGQTLPAVNVAAANDKTEWTEINLSDFDYNNIGIPSTPDSGTLKIAFFGYNNTSGSEPNLDALFKDMAILIESPIINLSRIESEVHTATNTVTSKNNIEENISLISDGRHALPGSLYFWTTDDLTQLWFKESGDATGYLHSKINVIDRAILAADWRTQLEGNFSGLCLPSDYATIDGLEGNFIAYRLSLDYKQNTSNATFYEIHKDTDPVFTDVAYSFRYLYKKAE